MNNDISKRYKFSLDSKSNNTLNNGQLLFNYGDDITLEITVTDGGVVKNIANCEVDLITVNQNATDVLIHRFVDGGITVREDNTIVIVCKSDYVDRLGTNVGQLIIRDEDQSITTQMFSYQTSTTLVSDKISGSVDGVNTIEDIMKVIANANLEIENFNRVTTGLESKIQATNMLVDNLTDRVNIEITSTNSIVNQVKLEESKRVQSEDARSSNEVSRVNSEYTRVQNEHVRSANEQDRITKETQRVQSETARESAENDRVSEENIRKTNEISRVNSESDRVSKEKERVTEEEARKVAEDSRKSAETIRAQSESQRVQSENTRSSNESNRAAKETERVNDENARKTAETARVTAETSRKNAELSRVTAEAERVAAEKYRADKFYEMEHEYDESITAEVVNNRQGYDGVVYANMYEARKADYEKLDNKFGDFTHSKFSGIGSFKADNTKEGLVKDISVKGRTLQNLCKDSKFNIAGSALINKTKDTNDEISLQITGNGSCVLMKEALLKDNTTYTFIFDFATNTRALNNYVTCSFYSNISDLYIVGAVDINTINDNRVNKCVAKATTTTNCTSIVIGYHDGCSTGETITLKNLIVLEGDHTNTPLSQLPYAEGIYSVGSADIENGKNVVEVKSCGKNLFNPKFLLNDYTKSFIKINGDEIILNGTINQLLMFEFNVKEGTYSTSAIGNDDYTIHAFWRGVDSTFQESKPFTITEATKIKGYINKGTYNNKVVKLQLEESSVSTSYEPYKESSIKYLLDEPLRSLPNGVCDETVGDKLIRRVGKIVLNGTENIGVLVDTNNNQDYYYALVQPMSFKTSNTKICLCDKFIHRYTWNNDNEGITIYSAGTGFTIKILSNKLTSRDIEGFKKWLASNPTTVYYELATPIITDIGIKTLKGYDGITNMFMNNTLVSEISAKVPLDLTSEIEANRKDFNGNLYPSMYEARRVDTAYLLDKINNAEYLEKTGCNITATNSYDGLTKDLSVKGRTLQNLYGKIKHKDTAWVENDNYFDLNYDTSTGQPFIVVDIMPNIKPNTTYTIISEIKNYQSGYIHYAIVNDNFSSVNSVGEVVVDSNGIHALKLITKDSVTSGGLRILPRSGMSNSYSVSRKIMILEGDYTNVPLSELPYIEGIKSTGEADVVDGKYPISVKSYGKNIIDIDYVKIANMPVNQWGHIEGTAWKLNVPCKPNTRYYMKYKKNSANYKVCVIADRIKNNFEENESHGSVYGKVNNSTGYEIVGGYGMDSGGSFVTPEWANYLHFTTGNTTENTNSAPFTYELSEIIVSEVEEPYEPYKESSIKYLLDEPLRSLPNGVADEIKGNQLIRRVGKVILNGSEDWRLNSNYTIESFLCFNISLSDKSLSYDLVCDKFAYKETGYSTSILYECCSGSKTSTNIFLKISNSKVATQDLEGFKKWLASNPTTVYYELATPIITTLDQKLVLNTYDTTTHISSDNTLLPTITTKVPSNVQAVVANLMEENKELNNQVSTLSVENEELKATNEVQDEMIDVTMCATDEMFTMLEPLLTQVMKIDTLNTNNKEVVNPMVDMYVAMVQRGLKTIDQVPARYREQVEAILAELDK